MSVTQSTRTVTVNAAFLQEIKEVNQELWQLLGEIRLKCQKPSDMRAAFPQCVENLNRLRDQLALHFALEEAYGYFEQPVSVAPQLCEQAATLKAEHGALYRKICDVVEAADEARHVGQTSDALARVVAGFERFDRQFKHHEMRENDLIQEQFDGDIGVGD